MLNFPIIRKKGPQTSLSGSLPHNAPPGVSFIIPQTTMKETVVNCRAGDSHSQRVGRVFVDGLKLRPLNAVSSLLLLRRRIKNSLLSVLNKDPHHFYFFRMHHLSALWLGLSRLPLAQNTKFHLPIPSSYFCLCPLPSQVLTAWDMESCHPKKKNDLDICKT